MFSKIKLSTKIALTIAASLLVTVTLLLLFFGTGSRSFIESRVTTSELPAILGEIREGISKDILVPLAIAKQVAKNSYLIHWADAGEDPAEVNNAIKYLREVKKENKADTVFFVSNQTKTYYTQDGPVRKLGSDDKWFYNFIASGKSYITDMAVQKDTGQFTLFINFRMEDKGKVLGVGGIGIKVSNLSRLIETYKIGKNGYVVLTDGKGNIRIRPGKVDKIDNIAGLVGNKTISNRLMQKKKYSFVDFNDAYTASSYIPSLDWYVVSVVPKTELFSAFNLFLLKTLLVSLLIGGILVVLGMYLGGRLIKPVQRITELLHEISEGDGDLTTRLPVLTQDEVGELSGSFNMFVEKIAALVSQVQEASMLLGSSVSEVDMIADQVSAGIAGQQDRLNLMSTAILQMSHTVQDIAKNAAEAADQASGAANTSNEGQAVVRESHTAVQLLDEEMATTTKVIEELAVSSEEIGKVVEVIRGISEQTNLLALNAAIEAARAGEQGRGFAVVADEVRTLAQRTQESTDEIRTIIESLQKKTEQTVVSIKRGSDQTRVSLERAESASASLKQINEIIDTIQSMTAQIATATEEQSVVTDDISKNVHEVDGIAQENAEHVVRLTASMAGTRDLSERLSSNVDQFKV